MIYISERINLLLGQVLLESRVMPAGAFSGKLLKYLEQSLGAYKSPSFQHGRQLVVMIDEAPQDVGKAVARQRQSSQKLPAEQTGVPLVRI